MSESVTLPSRFNRIMAIVAWAVSALMAVTAVGEMPAALWLYPAAALVAVWSWAALWHPHVTVSDAGVRLANVTHTVDVPWSALIDVQTRYALTLVTPHARFTAWAAPAPSALRASFAGRRADNRERRAAGGSIRPGDLLGTESGDAATTIREQWSDRIERGEVAVGVADEQTVLRRPRIAAVATLLALLGATALAIAFG